MRAEHPAFNPEATGHRALVLLSHATTLWAARRARRQAEINRLNADVARDPQRIGRHRAEAAQALTHAGLRRRLLTEGR